MELPYFPMPGYRANEYLLVLAPHEELVHKIVKVREGFADKYRLSPSRFLKPHVPLVSFNGWEMMEEKLLHRLQGIALGIAPFKVEMKDYGAYPTHSIFINVVSKGPIQGLVRELKEAQRLMKVGNEGRPYFVDDPHVPLARKLKPWQFEQGWEEYSHRQFSGRFVADAMLLLRRRTGERGAFQVARRFDFMNLPLTTRQGSLFA